MRDMTTSQFRRAAKEEGLIWDGLGLYDGALRVTFSGVYVPDRRGVLTLHRRETLARAMRRQAEVRAVRSRAAS